jgi:F0F1-type ATP synthase assembly protein I
MPKWVLAARLIGIGWYIGICIAGGIIGGVFLDKKFGTSVIFTLVGLFLGLAVAFWGTYRLLQPLVNERRGREKED